MAEHEFILDVYLKGIPHRQWVRCTSRHTREVTPDSYITHRTLPEAYREGWRYMLFPSQGTEIKAEWYCPECVKNLEKVLS